MMKKTVSVRADASEYELASEKLQEILNQTMGAAVEAGTGATIRVVSESTVARSQELSERNRDIQRHCVGL